MNLEQLILDELAHGRWMTIGFISEVLKVSRREIEEAIEHLRLTGQPIIGSNDGVKFTTDPNEVRHYAQDRRRRLVSISKGTRALLNTARRLEGPQQKLWREAA